MTDFIDYDTILDDMVNLISANVPGFKKAMKDANDRDFVVSNMPFCDVRMKRVIPDNTGQQNYYSTVVVEVEVATFDLSSRQEAAKLRNDLTNAVQRLFQTNSRFGAAVDATQVGPAEFETGESEKEGAFVAGAVLQFNVFVYANM